MVTGDLLPSSAMIKELSQEFGIPISQEDLTEGKLLAVSPPPAPNLDFWSRKSTLTSEIQVHQEKYLQWRNTMILKSKEQKRSLIQVGVLSPWDLGCSVACWEIQHRWWIPEQSISSGLSVFCQGAPRWVGRRCPVQGTTRLEAFTPNPGVPCPS